MLLVSAGLILVSYDGKIVFYEGVILLIGLIGYNLLTMKLGRKESMEEYESSSKPMLSNVLRILIDFNSESGHTHIWRQYSH